MYDFESLLLILDQPDSMRFSVATGEAGYLLITDLYSPHFRAEVNGQAAEVEEAFDAFLAVWVPGSTNDSQVVQLTYDPASFRMGVWAALSGLIGGILALGVPRFWRNDTES